MAAVDIAQTNSQFGQKRAVITASETNQLKTTPGEIAAIKVWGAGTTWVIDVYDDPGANAHPVWQWLTARGNGEFPVELPMSTGIRIVTSGGTPGSVTVVYS